jgi:hypothetical protein
VASSVVVTIRGGSIEAIDNRIVSVVPMTRAAMVEARTQKSRGVGYPVSSLKVAPKLRETRVSITNTNSD